MFEQLNIPTLAIVENMSYFDCIHGHRHYPFGAGHLEKLKQDFNVKCSVSMPILEACSSQSDAGRPYVLDSSDEMCQSYVSLAKTVATKVVEIRAQARDIPQLLFDKRNQQMILRLFQAGQALEERFDPKDLRLQYVFGTTLDMICS